MVPFTRVPFWAPIFDPQPNGDELRACTETLHIVVGVPVTSLKGKQKEKRHSYYFCGALRFLTVSPLVIWVG